jgi:MoaA/NifB/PqqE/SkfB family radical SAM enzyme
MEQIVGIKRDLILLKHLLDRKSCNRLNEWIKEKRLKKPSLSILWFLFRQNQKAKLTKLDGRYVLSTFLPPFPSPAFERYKQKQILDFNGQARPYQLNLAVTHKCHFNCSHCSRTYRVGEELSTQRLVELVKELQDFGICLIALTGGEPLLRPDLEQIVKSIDERATSILLTSGDGLHQDRAARLKDAGLSYVSISLDHYDAKEHNLFRRSELAFRTALDAIEVSLKNRFYTAIHLTVRKDVVNDKFLTDYWKFAKGLGVQEIRITEPLPSGNWTWKKEDFFLGDAENKILDDFCSKAQDRKDWPNWMSIPFAEREQNMGCSGGKGCMYIDAFGNLFPCDFFQVAFGNIRQEPFETEWKKLTAQFKSPFRKCPLKEKISQLQSLFPEGAPIKPLSFEEACQMIDQYASIKELPDYYKKIGWK